MPKLHVRSETVRQVLPILSHSNNVPLITLKPTHIFWQQVFFGFNPTLILFHGPLFHKHTQHVSHLQRVFVHSSEQLSSQEVRASPSHPSYILTSTSNCICTQKNNSQEMVGFGTPHKREVLTESAYSSHETSRQCWLVLLAVVSTAPLRYD